jgi:hypothetical protein
MYIKKNDFTDEKQTKREKCKSVGSHSKEGDAEKEKDI